MLEVVVLCPDASAENQKCDVQYCYNVTLTLTKLTKKSCNDIKTLRIKAPMGILAFFLKFCLFFSPLFYSAVLYVKGRRDILVYTGMYVV